MIEVKKHPLFANRLAAASWWSSPRTIVWSRRLPSTAPRRSSGSPSPSTPSSRSTKSNSTQSTSRLYWTASSPFRLTRLERLSMSRSTKTRLGSTPGLCTRTSRGTPTSTCSLRERPTPSGLPRSCSTTRRARRSRWRTRGPSSASSLERSSSLRGLIRPRSRTSTCSRAAKTTWSCQRPMTQSSCARMTWPGIPLTLRSVPWTSFSTSYRYFTTPFPCVNCLLEKDPTLRRHLSAVSRLNNFLTWGQQNWFQIHQDHQHSPPHL